MSSEKLHVPMYKKLLKSQSLRLKVLDFFEFLPDESMIRLQYAIRFNRRLNLKKPVRFSEKLQWYKINYRTPLMTKCVDKVAVRDFVKERGLSKILTKKYAVYNKYEDIDFDLLPDSFVAKYNNGAQRNLIIKDKLSINKDKFNSLLGSWLANPLGTLGREWAYYGVTGKILVEEYIEPDKSGDLIDYKFFCFNGEPKFLYVLENRFSNDGLKHGIYDVDFNKLNVYRSDIKKANNEICKPEGFSKMLEIAKVLSAGFPHVRVDLYNIDGRIIFGELTFYNGSGYLSYTPDSFDYEVGKMFDLPIEII